MVGQESNRLLVVNPENGKVLEKIEVGQRPHSVALSPDGHMAYVSNQWADNIYLIDLDGKIIYHGGLGPFDFHPSKLENAIEEYLQTTD